MKQHGMEWLRVGVLTTSSSYLRDTPPDRWNTLPFRTDPALAARTTPVRAAHITDLRTALSQVYVAAGYPTPSYTDPTLTGVPAKAVHIAELRAAVAAIW